MFGWLRPTCPVDAAAKEWIEERLHGLSEEFESSVFTGNPVVLPTPEFFRDPYDGSRRSVRRLLGCVAPLGLGSERDEAGRTTRALTGRMHGTYNAAKHSEMLCSCTGMPAVECA